MHCFPQMWTSHPLRLLALLSSCTSASAIATNERFTDVETEIWSSPAAETPVLASGDSHYGAAPYLALQALDVMQSEYFEPWIGTWPTSIDWTGAVVNTHVAAILGSLTRHGTDTPGIEATGVFNRYFSHNIAYYFGEDAFSIRNEAYDDMLWVVLGWLESVKFTRERRGSDPVWRGDDFTPAFAHRARIFWELAFKGWDTELCDGGMIWNPRLTPYKNAITNQLFISASVAMYLHYPGENNTSPYVASSRDHWPSNDTAGREYDSKYLKAAIRGYDWLRNSNMTNSAGLYVDGFHVLGWSRNRTLSNRKCNERNSMVYTYNQGVVLSGLRGLWEATGNQDYLQDGYTLIRNVIHATGWKRPMMDGVHIWAGLGRNGVLEELCDRSASCSQDSQSFKGIFFQHLTQFCMPLPLQAVMPGKTHGASKSLAALHQSNCVVTGQWVMHNAKAAVRTRDEQGRFGMWWGQDNLKSEVEVPLPAGAVDYRNDPTILFGKPWSQMKDVPAQQVMSQNRRKCRDTECKRKTDPSDRDVNDRGRGRTVETQGGGLAVLRAAWELTEEMPGSCYRECEL